MHSSLRCDIMVLEARKAEERKREMADIEIIASEAAGKPVTVVTEWGIVHGTAIEYDPVSDYFSIVTPTGEIVAFIWDEIDVYAHNEF